MTVEGSEETLGCLAVIAAIGQRVDLDFLSDETARTRWGTLKADASGASNIEGLFGAGDAVTGPKTVIHAIAAGQRVAQAVDAHLSAGRWEVADVTGRHLDEPPADVLAYVPEHVAPAPRIVPSA